MKWVINSFRRDRLLNESLKSLDLRTDSVRHLDVCGSEVQQGMMKLSGDDGELASKSTGAGFLNTEGDDNGYVIEESHVDDEVSFRDDVMKLVSCDFELSKSVEKLAI